MSDMGIFRQLRVGVIISSMELPDDVTRWVNTHFSDGEKARALTVLRTANIHTGEPATPRLLRCAVVSSQGVLRRLEVCVEHLRIDWRDLIMAVEYKLNGRALDGGSNYKRVYDFNRPIDEASITN